MTAASLEGTRLKMRLSEAAPDEFFKWRFAEEAVVEHGQPRSVHGTTAPKFVALWLQIEPIVAVLPASCDSDSAGRRCHLRHERLLSEQQPVVVFGGS
jgi:hypothetical protein